MLMLVDLMRKKIAILNERIVIWRTANERIKGINY